MGENLEEGFLSAVMGLPLAVTGTGMASKRAENFLGSDGVVPPAWS